MYSLTYCLTLAEDFFFFFLPNNASNLGISYQTNFQNCLYRVVLKSVSNELLRLMLKKTLTSSRK